MSLRTLKRNHLVPPMPCADLQAVPAPSSYLQVQATSLFDVFPALFSDLFWLRLLPLTNMQRSCNRCNRLVEIYIFTARCHHDPKAVDCSCERMMHVRFCGTCRGFTCKSCSPAFPGGVCRRCKEFHCSACFSYDGGICWQCSPIVLSWFRFSPQ